MKLTIILPAFNEEAYPALTLDSIQTAAEHLRTRCNVDIDVVVVDNSNNSTAVVALARIHRWTARGQGKGVRELQAR